MKRNYKVNCNLGVKEMPLPTRCDRYRHDFSALNQAILPQYSTYLQQWIPGGRFEGCEYVVLNPKRCDRHL